MYTAFPAVLHLTVRPQLPLLTATCVMGKACVAHGIAYGQWAMGLAGGALLILGMLRLDLQRKRRKDKELLEHMRVEYETLQASLSKLEQMEALLRQQLRMQERLITAIMHDVKSPLYYLLISARSLSRRITSTGDGLQADANTFYDATYRMYHLIDNLLQYVKLHAQNQHNIRETIALYELVAEKNSIFVNMAATRNIRILNQIDPTLTIESDRSMLAIILHNLLDNAIKFTEEGTVRITATVSEGEIRLIIEDSGIGMHAGWMAWVNEPYNRDRFALNPAFPAENGLGLIIVRELLAEINGRLHMSSGPNGSVAEVILCTE